MTPAWYVLTGGPSAGKSTMIAGLEKRGYTVVHEAARFVIERDIAAGETLLEIRSDAQHFQKEVLQMKLDRESKLPRDEITFFDRGIPDSLAYYRHEGIVVDEEIRMACAQSAYRRVFILDLISQENFLHDGARSETWDGAIALDSLLESAYREAGFDVVRVPVLPIEERIDYVLHHVDEL